MSCLFLVILSNFRLLAIVSVGSNKCMLVLALCIGFFRLWKRRQFYVDDVRDKNARVENSSLLPLIKKKYIFDYSKTYSGFYFLKFQCVSYFRKVTPWTNSVYANGFKIKVFFYSVRYFIATLYNPIAKPLHWMFVNLAQQLIKSS